MFISSIFLTSRIARYASVPSSLHLLINDLETVTADSAFTLALGCPGDEVLCSNSHFCTKRSNLSEPLINLLHIPYQVICSSSCLITAFDVVECSLSIS